jgi:hypothetical protein
LDLVKQASIGAVQATNPVAVTYGTVSQIEPLEVSVDQRFTLPEVFLVVPEHMTEYKVTVNTELGPQEIVIRRGLEVGDKVILLRAQGGQQYVIVGRVSE